MDYLGYRLDWTEEEGMNQKPRLRLPVAAMQWDLADGTHPTLLNISPAFYERNPFEDRRDGNISLEFQIRPMGCVHGHNTMADQGFTSLVDVDINVPISPIFVRDLAGRVIHIGYGPEEKSVEEWAAYGAARQDEEGNLRRPDIPFATLLRKYNWMNFLIRPTWSK